LVVDANGLGVGLVDYLVKPTLDVETGETLPPFSITNDEKGDYDKFITPECIPILYNVKANANSNSEMHVNVLSQIASGKVKFLIDEKTAKQKLLSTKVGKNMSSEQRAERLKPFTLTSILKEEMMNLRKKGDGLNITLERVNNRIQKDKFSAFEYGLYYIKTQEDKGLKKKKKSRFTDAVFYSPGGKGR
jgi:hypothetical protein